MQAVEVCDDNDAADEYEDVAEYFVQKCTEMRRNVQKCTVNVQKFTEIYTNAQKCTERYMLVG